MRILIASPIKQNIKILNQFLASLSELEVDDFECHYLFVDDCDSQESSDLLFDFKKHNENVFIISSTEIVRENFSYTLHEWNNDIIKKVAELKNYVINIAKKEEYDYLFLVDSDIVLHRETLQRLLSVNKDIVSNIFWTKISKCDDYEPQVWLMDQGALFDPSDPKTKSAIYRTVRKAEFISMLKEKGTYRVGGLGACTLISKAVLDAGVNFSKLYNISFWGEDRALCIRAVAAGFDLYVDTYYPAYHLYREAYIKGIEDYKKDGFSFVLDIEKLSFSDKIKRNLRRIKISIRCYLYYNFIK